MHIGTDQMCSSALKSGELSHHFQMFEISAKIVENTTTVVSTAIVTWTNASEDKSDSSFEEISPYQRREAI